MRIDAHTHEMHAEEEGKDGHSPRLRTSWSPEFGTPEALVAEWRRKGIEKILVLDPAPVVFETKKLFGDFVVPVPMVSPDRVSPGDIRRLLDAGGRGIKFIAPMYSYGDNRYFPLYAVLRERNVPAFFHTGYLSEGLVVRPGGTLGVNDFVDIANMRPSTIDRIARAFPELKIVMAHFGNPWWEEAWKVMTSHKNIYAELSGGTAYTRAMTMWKETFAPNGQLNTASVNKLCFATDGTYFRPGGFDFSKVAEFYDRLYDELALPVELRQKIDGENILALIGGS